MWTRHSNAFVPERLGGLPCTSPSLSSNRDPSPPPPTLVALREGVAAGIAKP